MDIRRACLGAVRTALLPGLIAGLGASLARAEEVHVLAAASLTDALGEIARPWEKATGHTVVFNLGASNDLARQIRAGAPADVFFSADKAQMEGLEKDGLVRAADCVELLSNTLVVVVPVNNAVPITAPTDLVSAKRIALADPEAVPAGVYARNWLESIGLWPRVQAKVVPTLNVRAALAAVESGNVDAGVVYKTDAAFSKGARVAYEVPRAEGPAIVYPVARVAASTKASSSAFVAHLQSDSARAVFARFGFLVVGSR
jgi:molybdate transport system substrate-binding protein